MPKPYKRTAPSKVCVRTFVFKPDSWAALAKLLGGQSPQCLHARKGTERILTLAVAREVTETKRARPEKKGAPEREAIQLAVKELIKIFRGYYRPPDAPKPRPTPYALRRLETAFVRRCLLQAKLIASTDGKDRAPSLRWYLEDSRLSGSRAEALDKIAGRADKALERIGLPEWPSDENGGPSEKDPE